MHHDPVYPLVRPTSSPFAARRRLAVGLGASLGVFAGGTLGTAAAAVVALTGACLPTPAAAQATAQATASFPSRPIRLINPYAAGASTDKLARLVAASMTRTLGQSVVVENKAGAGGSLAAEFVAKSDPDGYTFLLVSASMLTMNPSLYRKLPYRPETDFAPLTIAAKLPLVAVVPADSPIKGLADVIRLAKADPGGISYGSAGNGTSQHMAAALLEYMADIKLLHVPFRGGAPAMTELLAGRLGMMFVQVPSALPHIRSGRIRAVAMGSLARNPSLPDVPTFAESLPGYEADTWYGFVMPAKVPEAIGRRLHEGIVAAVREHAEGLTADGFVPTGSPSAEMAAVVAAERTSWAKVIAAAKISLD